MTERKTIRESIRNMYIGGCYAFTGAIDTIIETLLRIRNDAEKLGYTDITIEEEHVPYSIEEIEYVVIGTRIETHDEVTRRLEKEAKEEEKKKIEHIKNAEKEKKELVRLLKKYGN